MRKSPDNLFIAEQRIRLDADNERQMAKNSGLCSDL